MGTFSSKNSLFWGDLGAFLEEKSGLFCSKNALARADFGGVGGVIDTPFAEEIPLKVMKLGRRLRGWMGENGNKKEPQQRFAAALLGAIIRETSCLS